VVVGHILCLPVVPAGNDVGRLQRRPTAGINAEIPATASIARRRERGWWLWLEDQHSHVDKFRKGTFDAGAHIMPGQPAKTAAQWRDGDGAQVQVADDLGEIVKARLDVLDTAPVALVPLRRKVDDDLWRHELVRLVDEHAPGPHGPLLARSYVRLEVAGVGGLELQGESATHHADAVDGVDERVSIAGEDVASSVLDHGCAPGATCLPWRFEQ